MTAIGLTLVIYLACLILSGLIYWSCRTGNLAGFANAKRTVLAMYRAADAGLIRGTRASLASLVALAVLWTIVRAIPFVGTGAPRPITTAAYAMLAALAGGLSAILVAYIALNWVRVSALRAISSALVSADRLLVTVSRSASALALLIEGLGFTFSLAIVGLCWATSQDTPQSAGSPHVLLTTAQVLSDFAMGAILVAFAIQSSGTTYRMCSRMGSATAIHDAHLGDQDPRNPSTIADAAGIQLGQLVPSTLDAFCSSVCSNVVLLFMLWNLRTDGATSPVPASYLLLPLVLRAFGALATIFSMASARTLESLNPASALLRSQAVFVIVVVGAIGGGCTWLVPDHLLRLGLCGLAGFLLPLALGHWQNFVVGRALRQARMPRQTSDSFWAEGLSIGMIGAAGPLLILVLVFFTVLRLGLSTGLGHGEWLALMVCYLGMGIAMPFCVAIDATRPLVTLARRAVHLIDSLRVDDGQRRLARLEEGSYSVTCHAISAQTQSAAGMPLLAALAIGLLAKASGSGPSGLEALSTLYVCPLALLVPLAIMLQASLRASRALSNEVRRQISGFPQEVGVVRVPAEFTPSYRNCVDVAARESTRQRGLPSVAFVGIPLVYGMVLCHAMGGTGPAGRALALYLGVIAVTVTALGFILEAASDFANKACPRTPRVTNSQQPVVGDVIHHLAMHATPAIRLLAKATVIVALTYSPYVL